MVGNPIEFYRGFFVNCFIEDMTNKKYYPSSKACIFLLLKKPDIGEPTEGYETIYQFLKKLNIYIEDYQPSEEADLYIMIVFRVPDEFLSDYKLFKEGKYSEMSKKIKDIIIEANGVSRDKSIIGQVLDKSTELKKSWEERLGTSLPEGCEVLSIPDLNEESY